ncbi:cation-transporting P-type ATPase, partial [Enterococcus lactis]|uniref:P-type ATPase n=1 Tax=Enterococcus lactis TaxID=357441 RepID=UPI0022E3D218
MEKKKDTQKIYAAFAGKTKQELFELFHASPNGLSEEQIERSRETYGENAISYGEILKAYITPFTLVLIALGIISFITEYVLAAPGDKDLFGVAIIFTITEIPMEEIVCGDFVRLSAGDVIPADMRLLSAKDLFISQAALTGESYPVEKHAKVCEDDQQSETSYENLVFMGSNVISGSAEGIIVSVGNDTLFGHVAETLS